jgi:hypothetical protein
MLHLNRRLRGWPCGGKWYSRLTTSRTERKSCMGCTSSKAFKGEGHRLGTAATASTASPPSTGGQRIVPTTVVSQQPKIKPTKTSRGGGEDDNMRSAAARAAAQRAESVSSAIDRCPLSTNVDHRTRPSSPRSSHSRISYQQVRRGTNAANPNAGKLSDKLQEQNRKATLPPESQRDERLTVRT